MSGHWCMPAAFLIRPLPSPTLSPTDPVSRGLLTLCRISDRGTAGSISDEGTAGSLSDEGTAGSLSDEGTAGSLSACASPFARHFLLSLSSFSRAPSPLSSLPLPRHT